MNTEKPNLFATPQPLCVPAPLFSDKISACNLQELTPDELSLARSHAPAIERAILDARAKGHRWTTLPAALFTKNNTVDQELIAELCGTHDLDVTNGALGDYKVSWALTNAPKRPRIAKKNYLFADLSTPTPAASENTSKKHVCEERCDETMHVIRNSHTPTDEAFAGILEVPTYPKMPSFSFGSSSIDSATPSAFSGRDFGCPRPAGLFG